MFITNYKQSCHNQTIKVISAFLVAALIVSYFSTLSVFALSASGYSSRIANFNTSGYYSTGNKATDIVNFANLQKGKTGSQLGYDANWCAAFVSDCAKYVGCDWSWTATPASFKNVGTIIYTRGGSLASEPRAGDLALINWDNSSFSCAHVEIVTGYIPTSQCTSKQGNGVIGGVISTGGNTGSNGYTNNTVKVRTSPVNTNWGGDQDYHNCISYIVRPNYGSSTVVVPTATFDVNFKVDRNERENIDGIGYVEVYVDGVLLGSGTDFCQAVPSGKPYEVRVHITNPDYIVSGSLTSDTELSITGTTSSSGDSIWTYIFSVYEKPTITNLHVTYNGYKYFDVKGTISDPGRGVSRYEIGSWDGFTDYENGIFKYWTPRGTTIVEGNTIESRIPISVGADGGITLSIYVEAYDKTNVRQPTNCQSLVYYYNYPKAVASCTQGNHTYYLFDQQYSWEDAHQFAVNEMNGDLVSINSSAEDELMAELMAKGSRSAYYTGGIYNSNGNYTWSDGSDFLYTNWYSGEPNHEGSEFSTICLTSDGWYDVLSYKNLWGFIVEVVEPMSEYSVSVSDSSNGTVTVSASSAYEGDEIVVTAMPDTGYVLDCIKVNGTAISGNTFTMPSEDVTVEAVFKMKSINITSQPKNYTGLAGSTATFSVTAQGDGLTYQWQVYSNGAWSNSNATGSKTNKISFNVTNNHNGNKYRCIIKDINGQKVYSNTAKISVITPLTITKQPVNYTGAAGSTATFSITAQGDGLTYQWQVYSNGAWSNSNATGSKTNKISFNVTNNHNGNKYRCIVNDSNGQKVYSNTATITVTTPLKVTKQPVNYTGAAGSTASFSVTASGTGLTYQWQMYSDGAWKNSGATGSKTNKISFNVTSSHNGKKYRCIITDSNGQKVYSNTATVTVTTPLTVTKQPANYSGIAGSTASFSVTAQGTGLTYQWQVYSNGAWSNSNATGSKTNKISFKVTDSHNGNKYRCIVKDSSGQKVYSNTATISVFSPVSITKQPSNYTGAVGSTATFNVTASGTGLTYQWQMYSDGTWKNSGATGSKTSKISFKVTDSHDGKKYRCIITDSNGQKVYSNTATVTVTTLLTIIQQPANYTGLAGSTATFSVTAQGTELTYQWQVYSNGTWSNTDLSGANTSKLSFTVTSSNNGMKYRCVITDINGQKVISDSATVRIGIPSVNYADTVSDNAANPVTVAEKAMSVMENEEDVQLVTDMSEENTFLTDERIDGVESEEIEDKIQMPALEEPVNAEEEEATENRLSFDGQQAVYSDGENMKEEIVKGPSILNQPSEFKGKAGEKAIFAVKADGQGLRYQWQYCKDGEWIDLDVEGADIAELVLEITAADNGTQYRCVVTDFLGNTVITDIVDAIIM